MIAETCLKRVVKNFNKKLGLVKNCCYFFHIFIHWGQLKLCVDNGFCFLHQLLVILGIIFLQWSFLKNIIIIFLWLSYLSIKDYCSLYDIFRLNAASLFQKNTCCKKDEKNLFDGLNGQLEVGLFIYLQTWSLDFRCKQ